MNIHPALERAERYLETATLMIEHGDIETSISRSYYAMFYMARAFLAQKDIEPKTHSGMRSQFSLHAVKTGPVPKRYARMIDTVEELRTLADYAETRAMSEEDAELALRDARAFVTHLRSFLT